MGHRAANHIGLEKAPYTAEQSAEKIIDLVTICAFVNYSILVANFTRSTMRLERPNPASISVQSMVGSYCGSSCPYMKSGLGLVKTTSV